MSITVMDILGDMMIVFPKQKFNEAPSDRQGKNPCTRKEAAKKQSPLASLLYILNPFCYYTRLIPPQEGTP